MKPPFETVLEQLDLLPRLAPFDPVVIGTPPLGIATAASDIDIACCAMDPSAFLATTDKHFSQFEGYRTRQAEIQAQPATIVTFRHGGWELELFCQPVETTRQWGVRHFRVEQRLLILEPALRGEIRRLKESGLKTEPAFAYVLDLAGDPYEAVLALERASDDQLMRVISTRPAMQD